MAAKDPELRRLAGRAGGLKRLGDPEKAAAAQKELDAAKFDNKLNTLLAGAPKLTAAHRDKIIGALYRESGGDQK